MSCPVLLTEKSASRTACTTLAHTSNVPWFTRMAITAPGAMLRDLFTKPSTASPAPTAATWLTRGGASLCLFGEAARVLHKRRVVALTRGVALTRSAQLQ